MRTLNLMFHPLESPLPDKALMTFRKDAGWEHTAPPSPSQDPRGRVQWVAVELEKQQIGIARLELAPPQFCYVADLIVLGKFRKRGIGRWFIQRIEQYCSGFGIRRLLLEAGPGTAAFYAALDFHPDPLLPSMLKKDINPFQPKMFLPRG